jgi:formamidase
MPNTLIPMDLRRSPEDQALRPHNRWHPDIPAVTSVDPGSIFRVECLDISGGQILNSDSADDVAALDLDALCFLSGPIEVQGAEPGDLLVVDILALGPLPGAEWGYTAILDRAMGVGLLADDYPAARKAIWDLNGIFASSRHIEGVRFAGASHPGIIGCAPSPELLARWNDREAKVLAARSERFVRGVAMPRARGALLGHLPAGESERVAREAARTWAARENGGNIDVKEVTPGSRIFLPVFVPGAKLSVGDLQFSQGDGKVTGIGGIKMAGWIDLQVGVIRDGMRLYGISAPVFDAKSVERLPGGAVTFQGISVDEKGVQHYLDIWTAYRQACRASIQHLQRFGYSGEQAYVLLAAAPVEGRISCMLEHPNVCCTLALPAQIFDFDIGPGSSVVSEPRGELAKPS